MRKQLHQSALDMIFNCGLQFQFRYVEGKKRPPNAFLLVGTATDESVAQNLGHKIETKELLPRAEALGFAEAKFDEQKEKEPIELDDAEKDEGLSLESVIGEARDKTMNLSGLHYDAVAPLLHPKTVRRRFSIDMDGFLRQRAKQLHQHADQIIERHASKLLHDQASKLNAAAREGMDLAGEIDVQESYGADDMPILVVRDTKTSGKSPSKSLMDGSDSPGIADNSDQLSTYALATKVLDGKLPDLLALDYLVQTPARHDLKYRPTKTVRTDADIAVLLNRFANAVQVIRSGMFAPASPTWWGCSREWCGFWHECPMAKRPKLIQITKDISE